MMTLYSSNLVFSDRGNEDFSRETVTEDFPQVEDAANRCFTDFTVYRRHVLYPIRTSQLHLLFNSTLGLQTVRMVKTVSYSVHVWNKKSRNLSVDVGSAQGYALLADQFCPRVYRNCGTRF
ncbi:hypothetical protein J6590_019777 [Homalodisca vitripennis]|nr:hypothetical protein J6590_019777 [Homalodisca vitripennis]